jgi:hypothetical protein
MPPLPSPNPRRRNQQPNARVLPAAGRKGRPPRCPYELGERGQRWWRWAWKQPQAAAWDAGSHYALARRAHLEDELGAIADVESPDLPAIFEADTEKEAWKRLEWLLGRLMSRSSGSTTLMREMRELDDRFGLTPKSMAALRWTIGTEEPAAATTPAAPVPSRRLRAV